MIPYTLNNLCTNKCCACRCLSLIELYISKISRLIDSTLSSIQAVLQATLLPRPAASAADAVHGIGSVQKGQLQHTGRLGGHRGPNNALRAWSVGVQALSSSSCQATTGAEKAACEVVNG